MTTIGLLSDTHSFLDNQLFNFFKDADEIWHAGDFGSLEIVEQLSNFKKLRGVYGNIDGIEIREKFNLDEEFQCEEINVWITHIGGYPGKYEKRVKDKIYKTPPNLFICGHSHILKVMPDKKIDNFLHINPGAAGKSGLQLVRTAVRFKINKKKIEHLEVIELGKR